MKIFKTINLNLLAILSVVSGITKILQMPQELEFFGAAGFSNTQVVIFGAAQLLGGVLLYIPKTRIVGAAVMAVTFVMSTALIFMAGNIGFGLFSVLPIAMAGLVIWDSTKALRN